MAKFNKTMREVLHTPTTTNMEGAPAFKISEQEELVGGIVTSFAADAYYESWEKRGERLLPLIAKYPLLAGKAAVFARRYMNMRSISHWVVAQVCKQPVPGGFRRDMVRRAIVRPDDVTEILACIGKKIPIGAKRGIADSLEAFNEYQLAKYAKFGRDLEWNLNDAMRLCHPKATPALEALMHRTLKNTDTWEAMGNTAETWITLLRENKLGYLALLRNLRNIVKHNNPELVELTRAALLNQEAIKRNRVLPFRYITAIKVLQEETQGVRDPNVVSLCRATVDALTLSTANIPAITGTTAILIDGSGSMENVLTARKQQKPVYSWADIDRGKSTDVKRNDVACLFAAILCGKTRCVPIIYSDNAFIAKIPVTDNLYDVSESFKKQCPNSSTSLAAALVLTHQIDTQLRASNQGKIDRIIVITDEEGWQGTPRIEWFKGEIWMINLAGYGTSEFHPDRRRTVYGFSEKILSILPEIERGGIVKYVEDWYERSTNEINAVISNNEENV